MTADSGSPVGLSPAELHVSDLLSDAINAYFALPEEHPADQRDFTFLAHRMQDMLMARCARHCHPEHFPNQMPKPPEADDC